ncbi:MAG: hydantoinase/carbamoylase family amidase, partial [Solirubrobacterales bacterium]
MSAAKVALDSDRVLGDLRQLRRLTHGAEGASREAWGEGWRRARAFLEQRLAELGLAPERDEAGNLWAEIEGTADGLVAVGSHLDSVPGGGWLDGALGVMAGLELLRTIREAGEKPACGVALVDFADEEGSRFGRSLLGSSAVAGRLDPRAVADLRDRDGVRLEDALAENGVSIRDAPAAARRAGRVLSYLELHIEQGPVLEDRGLAVAAVRGVMGIDRRTWRVRGRGGHAGSTPMPKRRDPMVAAARAAAALPAIATELGGLGTVGRIEADPGVATAVAAEVRFSAD